MEWYFYANACHVCRIYGKNVVMKRCSNCKMIAYCSREHQRVHWKAHKDFCKAIVAVEEEDGPIFDIGGKKCEKFSFVWHRNIRFAMYLVHTKLGRELLQYEKRMLYYPRSCLVCFDTDQRRLTDCSKCPGASFCPDHVNTEHEEICKLIKLCFELEVGSFLLPDKISLVNIGTDIPKDMPGIMKYYGMTHDKKKTTPPLDIWTAHTADGLSRPYTLLHAIQKLSISEFPQNIHIVGADKEEFNGIECWEAVFHHHQSLHNVEITLIGPELENNTFTLELCKKCIKKGAQLRLTSIKAFYHDYVVSEKYTKPNFVAGFNIGIHEPPLLPEQDNWLPTIEVIENLGCPVLFTAFTLRESKDDIGKINFALERDVKFVYSGENPFRSMWPMRDPGEPIFFYKNQYLTIYEKF